MDSTLVPFSQEHLEPARDLFLESYAREREHSPMLPARDPDELEWFGDALRPLLANPGVALVHRNQLLAYMLTGFQFPFKGQNAVMVPEYCHASVVADKPHLYQRMYLHLAQEWASNQSHVHICGHFAHDSVLQETLHQLGFGAILAEQLRDLSVIDDIPSVSIVEERDVKKLVTLQLEHNAYYKASPIFILKSTNNVEVVSDLESHRQGGDAFLVYYEGDEPCAYMIVGTSTIEGEGFLLRHTNTAQIKSAYAQPTTRGKGIGRAILHHAITWAQQHGYDRLFVEHETANYSGGRFWRRHFTPYMYFAMRYIDNRI